MLPLHIDAILSNYNPAAVEKILNDDGYIVIPSDQIILRTLIQKIEVLREAIKSEDQAIREDLDGLFCQIRKIKAWAGMFVFI